ncbi:MAG: DegV family protein [Clostridiales bacterium]|nr:DegV family protein [Candidatus Blautia equi]
MYHIVADSGCDIFELAGAPSFATVPLTISTDKDHFLDDKTLNTHAMIEHMLAYKGRSFTACPSTEAWMKAFDLPDGSAPEELFIVTLTSGLSGTYNSACVAKDMYLELHPETKAYVVDSLSVGPEMVLILEKIRELKNAGCSFEEVCEQIRKYQEGTRLFFAFKSLHNLAENGRVNKLVAAAAGVLGISVCGTASPEGEIQQTGKARGDKHVVSSFLKSLEEAGYKGGKLRISQTENEKLAEKIRAAVVETYPSADVQINPVRGLCAYYTERGGVVLGMEA